MAVPTLRYQQVQKFRFHRDLRGHVDTTEVLRDVSLEFGEREVAAIVGPSGAGKTTLLRLACRLEEPNGGMVFLHGKDIRTLDVRDLRRRVGLVFQSHVLFGESVEDNVCYGLRVRGLPREQARDLAGACLERVGLDHSFLVRKNTSLNSSQIARVVLARTLILDPEVLLLDEPTARLDPETAADLFEALTEIRTSSNTTVIFSTSRLEEAREFAFRVIVMLEGEVATDVPVEDLLAGAVPDRARRYLMM
jgi:ABC-type methionine transport system ATPase subunit